MNLINFSIFRKLLRDFLLFIPIPNKHYYVFFFNFFAKFYSFKTKIYYKKNHYYLTSLDWRFSLRKAGIYFYLKGIERRINILNKNYFIDKIEIKENDIIIDCGANNGDLYLCFDKKINYYGIEPSPIVFENLKFNVRNQNLINKGLWSTNEKKIKFYLKDEGGDSSIIKMNKFEKIVEIETIKLDNLIKNIGKKIKLIKIDGEGSEPEILRGLSCKNNLVEYISVDMGLERGEKQLSTVDECRKYLESKDFKLINYNKKKMTGLFKNLNVYENRS